MITNIDKRTRLLSQKEYREGTVVYQMCRELRAEDNEALLYAQKIALKQGAPLIVNYVIYNYIWLGATRRFYDWVLPSLKEVEVTLRKHNIPLVITFENKKLFEDLKREKVPHHIGAVVIEQLPLRFMRRFKRLFLQENPTVPLYEVDAHNCIPPWIISQKQEFAAHTMRSKMHTYLKDWLDEFDVLQHHSPNNTVIDSIPHVDWENVSSSILCDENVHGVGVFTPGEKAAKHTLVHFLDKKLETYESARNDFGVDGGSNLSPYIAHGNISRRRILLETLKYTQTPLEELLDKHANGSNGKRGSASAFIEETVIRAELAENFCFYNENYDTSLGFPKWAENTLAAHESDERTYIYSFSEFSNSLTHDQLWNAAQRQLIRTGKMHGYLRMYWAKKILEWSKNAEEAMKTAVKLNDTYELDGRDPNGYVGCAWSIGGLHDRAWFNRPIFGLVRYMAESGAKKHGDTSLFIEKYKA